MSFSNKKILYVIPYFVPAWSYGGPVKVSYDFAKELIDLGHDVSVATTDALDSKSRNKKLYERIDGIDVYRFKNVNSSIARNFNLYAPIGFGKWLKQNIQKYDIVHIHEFFTYQTLTACKICRKAGKPYLIQPHGSLSQYCRMSRFSFFKNILIRLFTKEVASSAAVIALNEQEKKDIAAIYPQVGSKIKIVPNGLDPDEFKNIKTINLHKRYNIPKENRIVVFIGRVHSKKGLDISLRALSQLKDEANPVRDNGRFAIAHSGIKTPCAYTHPYRRLKSAVCSNGVNFTFLIIGPDEGERDNLEKLAVELGIKDQVIFAGLMSGRRKLEALKSADLSLLNSRSEGLPTTLLESAAVGLPIICSRGSNLPEVEQYEAGFVVNTALQTAQKIKLILKDARLRDKLSQNAFKLADSFNLKKCAQTLNKIYESAL